MPVFVVITSNLLLRRQPAMIAGDEPDDGGDDGAGADQDDRRPDALADHLGHGALLGERVAELELDGVLPVEDELLPHGLVEVEVGALLGHGVHGEAPLGHQQPGGVARQNAKEHEVERRDENDRQQRVQDLAGEVAPFIHELRGCNECDSAIIAPTPLLSRSPKPLRGRGPQRRANAPRAGGLRPQGQARCRESVRAPVGRPLRATPHRTNPSCILLLFNRPTSPHRAGRPYPTGSRAGRP